MSRSVQAVKGEPTIERAEAQSRPTSPLIRACSQAAHAPPAAFASTAKSPTVANSRAPSCPTIAKRTEARSRTAGSERQQADSPSERLRTSPAARASAEWPAACNVEARTKDRAAPGRSFKTAARPRA